MKVQTKYKGTCCFWHRWCKNFVPGLAGVVSDFSLMCPKSCGVTTAKIYLQGNRQSGCNVEESISPIFWLPNYKLITTSLLLVYILNIQSQTS